MRKITAAVAFLATATSASTSAQTTDLGRSIGNLIGSAIVSSKQRKIMAQLSAPLVYTDAAGPRDAGNPNDPRNLDVAGVRIGMSVKEAQLALRTAGYTDDGPRTDQPSYAGSVMWGWSTQYGIGPNTNERTTRELVWKKGTEQITVNLIALPEGPKVSSVFYWAGEEAPISKEEFTRRVLTKYGEPVNDDPDALRWCTVKAPTCEASSPEVEYPLLVAFPNSRQVRLFGNDPAMEAALEERRKADIDSRKPADRAPSF